MQEIWKNIKDWEGYKISNLGRVKSLPKKWIIQNNNIQITKERFKKNFKTNGGYLQVDLSKNTKRYHKYLHRLLAEAFILNPENKPEVNHIDGNKLNNNLKNLEWVTSSENKKHAFKIGLKSHKGIHGPSHKLTEWDVRMIRKLYKNTKYWTQSELAKIFNVTQPTIRFIVLNKSWSNI
jgi:hypothetical protein